MMEWIVPHIPSREALESKMVLIPLFPFVGFLINGLFGRTFSKPFAGFVGTVAALSSFVVALMCVCHVHDTELGRAGLHVSYAKWLVTSDFSCSFGLYIDKLSSVMILVVTGIGTLIHLYSMGYMAHDRSVWRFFAYLNLFLFMMILLVLGDNILMTFVGWEGVGLCSYLLIGFWYEESKNAAAGMKAFVVNRIGDLGFLMGIFTLIAVFGTVNYVTAPVKGEGGSVTPQTTLDAKTKAVVVPQNPGLLDYTEALRLTYIKDEHSELPEKAELPKFATGGEKNTVSIPMSIPKGLGNSLAGLITLTCICLFIGATGKSAQIPLFVWLPDAMAGPTPVSALIHAATMVTSGIYMVCRLHSLFAFSETALLLICGVGAATALFAALIGLTQLDIKKVLAYSTVSQLGYMFIGLGAGAFSLGIFHVLTHAFFKALLFLGAGSVIHAMSNEQDMRKMGGLKGKLPWTFATMLIGSLALAGVPGTSGWFSKDNILATVLGRYNDTHNNLYLVFYIMGIVAAFCTAFYTFRLVFLTFFGENRSSEEVKHHIHESPWTMVLPLVVLAFLALAGGFLFGGMFIEEKSGGEAFEHLAIRNVPFHEEHSLHEAHTPNLILTGIVALLGIGLAFFRYGKGGNIPDPEKSNNLVYKASFNKFYVDEIYDALIVFPFCVISELLHWGMDIILIDGLVCGAAELVRNGSSLLKRIQTGLMNTYAFAILSGTVAFLIYLLIKVQ